MTIMNKKIMQKLAKFNCSKNKQTKAVNQIKKATSYMLLRRCNRCSSAVCLQNKKQNKKFVYKSAVEHTLKQTQVTQIFHCRHSKKSEFPTHRSPKTRKEKSVKQKTHMIFFFKRNQFSPIYEYEKRVHQNIQLRSQAHPKKPTRKNE